MLKNGGNSLKMSDKNKKTNKKNGKELLKMNKKIKNWVDFFKIGI
jgi:hypothetical protein